MGAGKAMNGMNGMNAKMVWPLQVRPLMLRLLAEGDNRLSLGNFHGAGEWIGNRLRIAQ